MKLQAGARAAEGMTAKPGIWRTRGELVKSMLVLGVFPLALPLGLLLWVRQC
jgi:hypothetical protein